MAQTNKFEVNLMLLWLFFLSSPMDLIIDVQIILYLVVLVNGLNAINKELYIRLQLYLLDHMEAFK
jgi:hypothetical protein